MLYSRGVAQMKLGNIPEALADFMSCNSSIPQKGIDTSRLEGYISTCEAWLINTAANNDEMMLSGDEGDDNSTSNGSVVSSSVGNGNAVFGINPSSGKLDSVFVLLVWTDTFILSDSHMYISSSTRWTYYTFPEIRVSASC